MTESNLCWDLMKKANNPFLQENVRHALNIQTGFQQLLAVEAITQSFFKSTSRSPECPNVLTLISRDEDHAVNFIRSFKKTIEEHFKLKPLFIDAGRQYHQDFIPKNGFAFVLIRELSDLLNKGLYESNRWDDGNRHEYFYENYKGHLNTLKKGYLKTERGKVNYENVTFIFLLDPQIFQDLTIDKIRNVSELNNAKPRIFQAIKEVGGSREFCFSSRSFIDQLTLDYLINGDIVLLDRPSFFELAYHLDGDSERLKVFHYNDDEAKFLSILSCVNEPGLTFHHLETKQADYLYDIPRQLKSQFSEKGALNPEDARLIFKSGKGKASAKEFVEKLRDERTINVAQFEASPLPNIMNIFPKRGLNAYVKHFNDFSQLCEFNPDIAIIPVSHDNADSAKNIMINLQGIFSQLPIFLANCNDGNREEEFVNYKKTFSQLVGEISPTDLSGEFVQLFSEIQLTKALRFQETQQNTYPFLNWRPHLSCKTKTYCLEFMAPVSSKIIFDGAAQSSSCDNPVTRRLVSDSA